MALQKSVALRNAQLAAYEAIIGTSPVLKLFTGAAPANVAASNSGTVLATLNLPSDWMEDAASGVITKKGTWQDTAADATGTIGHFRLYQSDGTTCHLQGEVTLTAGGGVLTVDNLSVTTNQTVIITAFSVTGGNA